MERWRLAVIIGVAALFLVLPYTPLIVQQWNSTFGAAGHVEITTFINASGTMDEIGGELPRGRYPLASPNETLAALLDRHGIDHKSHEVQDVFGATVALQKKEEWVVVRSNWSIITGNRARPLSAADAVHLEDGETVQFVLTRDVVGRAPVQEPLSFITYVAANDSRNGQGDADYLSCVDNEAIHLWGERYKRGQATVPNYPSDPPVCGAHVHGLPPTYNHDIPAEPGAYILPESFDPVSSQIHALGHGMTVVQYRADTVPPSTVAEMRDWTLAHPFTYLAPNPRMETPVALTRWGMIGRLDTFNRTRFERFQQAPYNILPPMSPPRYFGPFQGSLQYYHTAPHLSPLRN